ncbi:MAG: protein kinase, partial [Planctomycetota bacterium JB042]
MERPFADAGRHRLVRALGEGDDAPLLVEDRSEAGARRVLRRVSPDAAAAALLFRGLRHEGIAELLRLERHERLGLVSVSAWVEGEDLGAAAARLDSPARLAVVHDVARALRHLHELGLTHGDLKPANVVVTPAGRGVLIDPAGPDAAVRGSLPYMAPERILGGPSTPASDLYALGGLLCFVLTGRPPHEGDDPLALVRAVL